MWMRPCAVQGANEKAEIKRFRVLSVRAGVAGRYESKDGCDPPKQRAGIFIRVGRDAVQNESPIDQLLQPIRPTYHAVASGAWLSTT